MDRGPESDLSYVRSKELCLDTKGTCFLCLKDLPNTMFQEVCFRNICRFLDINSCSVLLKSLKGRPLTDEEKAEALLERDKCDFSVMLCPACASLTMKFSALIREVELAKLMLNHKLEQIHQVFKESENGNENESQSNCLWRRLEHKMMSNSGSPVEIRLVKHLREETQASCATRVTRIKRTCLPKVVLQRNQAPTRPGHRKYKKAFDRSMESSHVSTRDTPVALTESVPAAIAAYSFSGHERECLNENRQAQVQSEPSPCETGNNNRLPKDIIIESATSSNKIIESPPPLPSIAEVFAPLISNNYANATTRKFVADIFVKNFEREAFTLKRWRCLVCNLSFTEAHIRQHFVREHTEMLFEHKKLNHLSNEIFKECCSNLFSWEKSSVARVVLSDSEGPTKKVFLCSFCALKYTDEQFLKFHLVTEHFHILEETIVRFQQDPPQPNQKCRTGGKTRKVQRKALPVGAANFEALEHVSDSARVTKKLIRKKIMRRKGTPSRSHQFIDDDSTEEMILLNEDQCGAPETLVEADVLNNAALVSEQHTETISLSRRNVQVPEASSGITNYVGTSNQPIWNVFYKKIEDEQFSNGGRYKCLLCSSIHHRSKIRHHLVINHPENLFAEKRLTYLSEQEFRTACVKLLNIATRQSGRGLLSTSSKERVVCSLCNVSFCDKLHLKYHLVTAHYNVLEEKLTLLQLGKQVEFGDPRSESRRRPVNFAKDQCRIVARKRIRNTNRISSGIDVGIVPVMRRREFIFNSVELPQEEDPISVMVEMNEQGSGTDIIYETNADNTCDLISDRMSCSNDDEWDHQKDTVFHTYDFNVSNEQVPCEKDMLQSNFGNTGDFIIKAE